MSSQLSRAAARGVLVVRVPSGKTASKLATGPSRIRTKKAGYAGVAGFRVGRRRHQIVRGGSLQKPSASRISN
jgi:hypothetical protein